MRRFFIIYLKEGSMMAGRKRRKPEKPYLQWSKKQSGAVTAFFMAYFVFVALCVANNPAASDALVQLAMAVAGVMGANLAMYGGASSFEKFIAGKYGDFMQYKYGKDKEEKDDEKDSKDKKETNG